MKFKQFISRFKKPLLIKLTLKKQLLIMICLFLVFFLVTQLLYTVNFILISHRNSVSSNTNVLNQVGQNIDSFYEDQVSIATTISSNKYVNSYLIAEDPLERHELQDNLSDYFSYIFLSDPNILDVTIIDNDNRLYGIQAIPSFSIWNSVTQEYERRGLSLEHDSMFDLVSTPNASYYVLCQPIYYRSILSEKIGNCMITSSSTKLQEILNRLVLTEHSMVYLVNAENRILAAHDYHLIGSYLDGEIAALAGESNESLVGTYQDKTYSIQHLTLEGSGWTLVSMIPVSEILTPLFPVIRFGLLLFVITLLLLSFISCTIFRSITFSVNSLAAQMENMGKGTLHGRIEANTNNEIGRIAVEINRMLEQIDKLNHDIFNTQSTLYETELLKKDAEFLALQNQINPHFLYNTLECIRDIALVYQADEISSIAISMTKIFRYCIKAGHIVSIADEMACIDNYIEIVQIRYQNRFVIHKDIDPALLSKKMMKFLLQPIIENAIFHGLELKSGQGTLWITGKLLEKGIIRFEIRDDGVGIPADKLADMKDALQNDLHVDTASHTGVGLLNIHSRVKNKYGAQYGIQIESQEKKGTCVTISFPSCESGEETSG